MTLLILNGCKDAKQSSPEASGDLLKEIQRVKSEGDFESGKKIIEDFGVKSMRNCMLKYWSVMLS